MRGSATNGNTRAICSREPVPAMIVPWKFKMNIQSSYWNFTLPLKKSFTQTFDENVHIEVSALTLRVSHDRSYIQREKQSSQEAELALTFYFQYTVTAVTQQNAPPSLRPLVLSKCSSIPVIRFDPSCVLGIINGTTKLKLRMLLVQMPEALVGP